MVAIKALIKSLGAVAVVGSVAGGVGYKIHQSIQTKKEEENNKEINANNIELQKLIEKLEELKEELEVIKQNIADIEKKIKELEEIIFESTTKNKDLNEEISSLIISINSLNKTIKEKSVFKNDVQEAAYQKSIDSLRAKILQNNSLLKQHNTQLFTKNIALITAKKAKSDDQKRVQHALTKKTSDSNVVATVQTLLDKHKSEESAAFNLYDEQKWKRCVQQPLFSENAESLTCKNRKGDTINKSEEISESDLDALNADKTKKKNIFLATTEILRQKQAAAAISFNNWSAKTELFNKKSKLVKDLENAKGNLESQIKRITLTMAQEWKDLKIVETSLESSKAANPEEKKLLSEALAKKVTEEKEKQKVENSLLTTTQTLEESKKTVSAYKATLTNLNIQKWELEATITAKEKLKATFDKKIHDLTIKNA